jgi:nitrate reductase gamma subunit
MTAILYLLIYAGLLAFLAGCAVRAVRYARLPLHLRWELYPVPHESPGRVRHGGSRYEESDWWTRPARFHLLGELKAMLPEMLFLKGLWAFNRSLWFCSFPFHFGLYLVIKGSVLVVASAALTIFAPSVMAGGLGVALHYLYGAMLALGLLLTMGGALALLARRLGDNKLRAYTTPADIFNLCFFLATFGLLAAGYLTRPEWLHMRELAIGILRFDTSLQIPGLLAAGLVAASLLAAYIPMTHMAHFIAKYFTYHMVRWDDRANERGSHLEKKFAEYLTYRPTWAARHVGADGQRTWAEVATANPNEWVKK